MNLDNLKPVGDAVSRRVGQFLEVYQHAGLRSVRVRFPRGEYRVVQERKLYAPMPGEVRALKRALQTERGRL